MLHRFKVLLILYGFLVSTSDLCSLGWELHNYLTKPSEVTLSEFIKKTSADGFGSMFFGFKDIPKEQDIFFYRFTDVCPKDVPDPLPWAVAYFFIFYPFDGSYDEDETYNRLEQDIREALELCSSVKREEIVGVIKKLLNSITHLQSLEPWIPLGICVKNLTPKFMCQFKSEIISSDPIPFYVFQKDFLNTASRHLSFYYKRIQKIFKFIIPIISNKGELAKNGEVWPEDQRILNEQAKAPGARCSRCVVS